MVKNGTRLHVAWSLVPSTTASRVNWERGCLSTSSTGYSIRDSFACNRLPLVSDKAKWNQDWETNPSLLGGLVLVLQCMDPSLKTSLALTNYLDFSINRPSITWNCLLKIVQTYYGRILSPCLLVGLITTNGFAKCKFQFVNITNLELQLVQKNRFKTTLNNFITTHFSVQRGVFYCPWKYFAAIGSIYFEHFELFQRLRIQYSTIL